MDAITLLSSILGCGISDINYLFSGMDDKLLCDAIDEIHNEDMEMSAENLWTECIQLAAERIFKTQSDFISTVFNCIDSHVWINKKYIQFIEDFEEKKDKLEELTNETLEIWEV
ncbi:MAG: hypothetical protein J6S67_04990 [Methanobrevibacter sp.]|nr:hypothetical protein [Methanobrevibacter sp.]